MLCQSIIPPSQDLNFVLVLFCVLFGIVVCGPCAMRTHLAREMDEMKDLLDFDACGSFGEKSGLAVQEYFVGEINSKYVQGNLPIVSGGKAVCRDSDLFCFPSTLRAFLAEEHNHKASSTDSLRSQGDVTLPEAQIPHDPWESNSSWLVHHGRFALSDGKVISCSLNSGMEPSDVSYSQGKSVGQSKGESGGGPSLRYHKPFSLLDKKTEIIKSNILDGSSSPNVDISPPFLDWGRSYLYFTSLANLTVTNTCNESSLVIYKPFSTDSQFYPYDFDEVLLGPGEVAKIGFVFLPQQLGLLKAHIVLQTSAGGFLIRAKGVVIESLYQIQPLVGLNVSLDDGGLNKNLSLYNPFDETLYVKEVTAYISVSSENKSHSAEAFCKVDNMNTLGGYSSVHNIEEWLDIRSDHVHLPLMALRPHRSWEIRPHSTETIVEINFLSGAKGSVFGTFSMEVQRSSQDKADSIVVPLEAEVRDKSAYSDLSGSVLLYLEPISSEGCKSSVILSLKNRAAHLLRVTNIIEVTENTKMFHIKFMEGLLLFPGNVTQIAIITCQLSDSEEPPEETFDVHLSCKLHVMTNDSSDPQIEIPCQDVIQACSKRRPLSYIGHELQREKSMSGSEISRSLGHATHSSGGSSETKAEEVAEADEIILRNWRSLGTTGKSVLDDDEVLYPVVQVGSHCSKWITVKNPSEKPVLMQLILNSGTVIDECKSPNKFIDQPLSSSLVENESTKPTKYGFSIPDTATVEAFVHPHGKALLGPIIFHPSNRCGWRGSALVRNNLSGVEWLSLKGFGGSISLVLLEDSETVKSLEFNLNLSNPHMKNTSACSMSLSKDIQVMNTGDLPLEVRKIEISGTSCGLDGFTVQSCKGFSLEPGESRSLRIVYKPDFSFSSAVIRRDLELSLLTGIFVIPMKAGLPVHLLGMCRKPFFWVLLKKLSLVIFITALATFVVFSFVLPKVMAFSSQDCLFKTKSGSIRKSRKSNIISLVRSVREDETLKPGFVGGYSDCSSEVVQLHQEETKPEEASNLTVKIGKEKSKRRRKKKTGGGGGTGLPLLEVSSSQSGNSTPSSPISPVMSFAHRTSWSLSPDAQPPISAPPPRKEFSKVVQLPVANFPTNPPPLPPPPPPPHARAPGSNLRDKGVKNEAKEKVEDGFVYDIWGDHLSTMISKALDGESRSFFVRGPQKSGLSHCGVASLCQNG